jgi:hypothetical protein
MGTTASQMKATLYNSERCVRDLNTTGHWNTIYEISAPDNEASELVYEACAASFYNVAVGAQNLKSRRTSG